MPDVSHTFDQLETLVQKHYTNPDLDLLRRAFAVAQEAHKDEVRLTGEPFISHPIAVAYTLAEMGLHINVVAAGLLHDVIEDSAVELDVLKEEFGDDIASLVDSVTKLKRTVKYRGTERYAENLRKMFLAMASDVRVVFMKFADRLHNLQTLYGQPKHKQERIARESLEIYAPIAGRLGMSEIKGELEDYSFAYLKPKDYERMKSIMDIKVREKGAYVSRVIGETEHMLAEAGIKNLQVHGRVKRLFSLYKKMKKHEGDLSKIYDLIAVRVIVGSVEDCYTALGVLHQKWRPAPGRIKDYIAQPKPNGYQSLHTTVFTSEGEIVEFQIRTQEMHDLAEYGVAAHWRYKEGSSQAAHNMRWMEELAQIQRELAGKKNFLEQLEFMKIDVFKDRIFIFTPQGDVIDLPEGATPVDFAYAIHSEVGNKCIAVRINDVMRNLDTVLASGDIVEIVTDKNRKGPNPDWLKFAHTRHARKKIRDGTRNTLKGWFAGVLRGRDQGKKTQTR
ncbi:bifunctional (p)ppGpp synthetase/guanosine-3',5'-bis(diphosphate) 3'-pyrophosphohydrolase [Candidatus Uhrbacteria bacterium]|nr:bifunctional (p)ppGpp synthetase/guanosine-3',5'-bis(diphosphate) 3'-pyrophosphohydrolase [Candidatus Uhrbacteria bacterium]